MSKLSGGWSLERMLSAVRVIGNSGEFARVAWWCLLEARPVVQLIFLLRFMVGASFAGNPILGGVNLSLWLGAALWACGALSVYIFNGVMDVEEDWANRSGRPVARGDLKVSHAAIAVTVLGILSIAGSLLLSGLMVWIVIAVLVLGFLYSGPPLYLKRWPAGLAATATVGGLLTYYAGYVANGGGGSVFILCLFSGMMALWMGLVGQTKDLSDAEGDRQAGRRSAPLVWGESGARAIYSGLALALSTAYAVCAVLFAKALLLSAVVVLLGALAIAAISLGPWSRGGRSRRRMPYKAFMLTQYGAHLIVLI